MDAEKKGIKVPSKEIPLNMLAICEFKDDEFDFFMFEGYKAVGDITITRENAIKIRDFLVKKLG